MSIRVARYALLGKLESSYGQDASPTAADSINAKECNLSKPYNAQLVKTGDKSTIYSVATGEMLATLTFKVYLTRAKTNGTENNVSKLLKACYYKHSTSDVNKFDTLGEADSTNSSITLYYYEDGILEKLLGARGSAKFSIEAGRYPVIEFTFTGLYESVGAAAMPSITAFEEGELFVAKGNTLTLASDYHSEILEFEDGNKVSAIRSCSAETGIYMIDIADSEPKGNLSVLVETTNAATLEALIENGTATTITYEKDATTNPSITLNVIVIDRPWADEEGFRRYSLGFVITGIDFDFTKPA